MITVERDVTIQATPETVWAYIEDVEKELQWRGPWVVKLQRVDSGPLQVGSQYQGRTEILGQVDEYTTDVVELEPTRKLAWKTTQTSGMMGGDGYYLLEPKGDGATHFTMHLTYMPMNTMGALSQPITRLAAGNVVGKMAQKLKKLCEA